MVVNHSSRPGNRGGFIAEPQPVAYDQHGNPLYAQQPHFVHLSRASEPVDHPVSPEIQRLHEESVRKYPRLNLSKSEYVILAVRRHPIGVFKALGIGAMLITGFMAVYLLTFAGAAASGDLQQFAGVGILILALVIIMTLVGVAVSVYVYFENRFYLTNESVIQEIQPSLFSENEQTVSLSNIEDASFTQSGVLAVVLNYGMIRLSTEGDETTYRFEYVANPKRHIAILNDAVEQFKNGRPVGMPDKTDD